MMSWAWTTGMIAAGMICQSASYGYAGEAVIYEYDNWSVTIAPRGSSSANARRVRVATPTVNQARYESGVAAKDDHRILIRPVSLEQVVPPPAAAPAPAPAPAIDILPVPVAQQAVTPNATPAPVSTAPAPPMPETPSSAQTQPSPAPQPSPDTPASSDVPPSLSTDAVPPCVNCDGPIINPKLREPDDVVPAIPAQAQLYRDIYFGLPFLRAEYNANPSYRHDTTMELLFNQMRPTVIQRGTTNVNNYGPYGGYGYGYGYIDPPYYPYSYGLRIHHSR